MYLFEFDQGSVLVSKIVALTNQLKYEVETGKVDPMDYTVDELLEYFQSYDVILDVNDLYNMIKVPPLKGLIKNIQGDKVVFKGYQEEKSEIEHSPEDGKKVVAKMAKRASDI